MRRRGFVYAIAGGGAAVALAAWGFHRRQSGVVRELRGLLDDDPGAREVGLVYLSQVPEERDPEVLASLVTDDVAWLGLDAAHARREIDAQIRRDFGSGDVVRLHGWFLSRTEARLCALAALGAAS